MDVTFKIGNSTDSLHDMPMPSKMTVAIQDVDYDSGRTANGDMHRNRVAVKRKLTVDWPYTDDISTLSTILNAISHESFYVRYLDPKEGGYKTIKAYAGDRSVPVYNYALGIWSPFSVGIIEY